MLESSNVKTNTEALNSNDAIAFNNRGLDKRHLDRYEDAIRDYDKAIALNPKNALAFIGRGSAK